MSSRCLSISGKFASSRCVGVATPVVWKRGYSHYVRRAGVSQGVTCPIKWSQVRHIATSRTYARNSWPEKLRSRNPKLTKWITGGEHQPKTSYATTPAHIQNDEGKLKRTYGGSSRPGERDYLRKLFAEIEREDVRSAFGTYRFIMRSPSARSTLTRDYIRSVIKLLRENDSAEYDGISRISQIMADLSILSMDVDVLDYNSLLSCIVRAGDPEAILLTLRDMRSKNLIPNTTTYNILLSYYANSGNILGLRTALETMSQVQVTPDLTTYNTILQGLTGYLDGVPVDELTNVYQRMIADKVEPDTRTYNLLLKGYVRADDLEAAMSVIAQMLAASRFPTSETFEAIITGLLRNGDLERAETHYHAMLRAGLTPESVILERFISVCAAHGLIEDAERWFRELTDIRPPRLEALLPFISLAARAKDLSELKNLLQVLRLNDIRDPPSVPIIYRNVFREMLAWKHDDVFIATHDILTSHGCFPDPDLEQHWRNRLAPHSERSTTIQNSRRSDVSFRRKGFHDEASDVSPGTRSNAQRVTDPRIFTDIVAFNRELNALAKTPETLPHAIEMYRALGRLRLAPTGTTFSALIGAYARIPDVVSVEAIWRELKASGVVPDIACHNGRIRVYLKDRNVPKATIAMEDFKSSGLKPTAYTTRLILEFAVLRGDLDAVKSLLHLVCRDRNASAYGLLNRAVEALVLDGRFSEAYECDIAIHHILADGATQNTYTQPLITRRTSAAMMMGLLGMGQWQKAWYSYQCAANDQWNIPLPEHLVLAMVATLCKHKMFDDLQWTLALAYKDGISRNHWRFITDLVETLDRASVNSSDGAFTYQLVDHALKDYPAENRPTARDAIFLLRSAVKRRSGQQIEGWLKLLSDHHVPLTSDIYENWVFGPRGTDWPNPESLGNILQSAIGDQVPLSAHAVALALEAMITHLDQKGAYAAYSYMKQKGYEVTQVQRSRVVNLLANGNMLTEAGLIAWDEATIVDEGILESLAMGYSSQSGPDAKEKVLGILDLMESGQRDKERHFVVTMKAMQKAMTHRNAGLAEALLQKALKSGHAVKMTDIISVLSALAAEGKVSEFLELLTTMVVHGIYPEDIVHNLIFKAYVSAGRTVEAAHILINVKTAGLVDGLELKPDAWAYNTVIAALARMEEENLLQQLRKVAAARGFIPDLATLTSLLPTAKTLDDVEQIKKNITKSGFQTDNIYNIALATAYARLKAPNLLEDVLKTSASNAKWSAVEWNLVLKGWKEVKDYRRCVDAFEEMTSFNVQPDVITINTLLSAALTSANEAGFDIVAEMDRWTVVLSRRQIKPDLATLNLFLRKQAVKNESNLSGKPPKNHRKSIRKRLNRFDELGFSPDQDTFIAIIIVHSRAYLAGEDKEAAKEMLHESLLYIVNEEMVEYKVPASRDVYDTITSVLSELGGAREIAHWMKIMNNAKIAPDANTMKHFVAALLQQGDLSSAELALYSFSHEESSHDRSLSLQGTGVPYCDIANYILSRNDAPANVSINRITGFLQQTPGYGFFSEGIDNHLVHMVANGYIGHPGSPRTDVNVVHRSIALLKKLPTKLIDDVTVAIALKLCLHQRWYEDGKLLWNWASGRPRVLWDCSPEKAGTHSMPIAKVKVFKARTASRKSASRRRWGFIVSQPSPRGFERLNEAFLCTYLDIIGAETAENPTSTAIKRLEDTWHDMVQLPILAEHMKPDEESKRETRQAILANFKEYPTENMCNSYIEALLRCGRTSDAVMFFQSMGGPGKVTAKTDKKKIAKGDKAQKTSLSAKAYSATPSAKTIRTIFGPLCTSGVDTSGTSEEGKPQLRHKVRQIISLRWPHLVKVADQVADEEMKKQKAREVVKQETAKLEETSKVAQEATVKLLAEQRFALVDANSADASHTSALADPSVSHISPSKDAEEDGGHVAAFDSAIQAESGLETPKGEVAETPVINERELMHVSGVWIEDAEDGRNLGDFGEECVGTVVDDDEPELMHAGVWIEDAEDAEDARNFGEIGGEGISDANAQEYGKKDEQPAPLEEAEDWRAHMYGFVKPAHRD
ncbi:uncharacterized protein EV422DRAFT_513047 [Fimicolochytrium jonesii]|uniref:uncharacterized protein n=1 Tax=Fimicolochytrium jonesii TaxID=1396493 RepID=UPI0022FF16D9|nr:uncharacterized protein EV422DRAFT_513047 [Fimicolochytrium jonesii]KAI8827212.1 hypothetical protein EV422DRAFT_513047 [Fimicolochytrium jonesii]